MYGGRLFGKRWRPYQEGNSVDDFISVLRSKPDFLCLKGAGDDAVKAAEAALGLKFSAEYRRYLEAFGAASAAGHEFTGICDSERLDIVSATETERAAIPDVPGCWYVVEQTNMDGITIWQDKNGFVYMTSPDSPARKIARSLADYLRA